MMDRYSPLRHCSCVLKFIPGQKKFPEKNIIFSYDARVGTLLFILYDEYRRPKTGRPRGGPGTNKFKKLLPAMPQKILKRRPFV
jgi:hypothetical protein